MFKKNVMINVINMKKKLEACGKYSLGSSRNMQLGIPRRKQNVDAAVFQVLSVLPMW